MVMDTAALLFCSAFCGSALLSLGLQTKNKNRRSEAGGPVVHRLFISIHNAHSKFERKCHHMETNDNNTARFLPLRRTDAPDYPSCYPWGEGRLLLSVIPCGNEVTHDFVVQ